MIWLAPSMTLIYLAQVNQVLGYGLMFPAMVGFIDDIMSKGEAVRGQAVFTTAITVGNVLGCSRDLCRRESRKAQELNNWLEVRTPSQY